MVAYAPLYSVAMRFPLRRAPRPLGRDQPEAAVEPETVAEEPAGDALLSQLRRARLRDLVRVDQPLVLISQVQRSGGTLLAQLLDGHPECHAYPHELKIGHPTKYVWPPLSLADGCERWWEMLSERHLARLARSGYHKTTRARLEAGAEAETFPFVFVAELQHEIFRRLARAHPPSTQRGIVDNYFTSVFNAWLDNQNLYGTPKRVVTAFTPRLAMDRPSVERFFDAYPDGMLVGLVRHPAAWWASARVHHAEYHDLDAAMELWRSSAEAVLSARSARPDRVLLVIYEDVVVHPEETMRSVASRIGITFAPSLLDPTFNGMPIKADSVEAVPGHGIIREPVERYLDLLSAAEIRRAGELSEGLYERAATIARAD